MNDMVLAPVGCAGLWGAAPAFEPAAKTGELIADAARTPAVAPSMSRRDTVERDVSEASFTFMLRTIEKRDQLAQANDATLDRHLLHHLGAPARALRRLVPHGTSHRRRAARSLSNFPTLEQAQILASQVEQSRYSSGSPETRARAL